MDVLALEMSIMNDQYKIETIALEHDLFIDLMYQNNTVLTEGAVDTFKKIVGIIKEKLIALKDKFLKAMKFIKDKIKEFLAKFKKESFEFINNIGSGKIMAGEKIKLSDNKLYDIDKISSFIDNLYNNKYVRNIKTAINSSNNVINYLNSGKFESLFVEINASKDKLPEFNPERDKLATNDNIKIKIDDQYKLDKDVITGKEAADYFKKIYKFTDNTQKYIETITKINHEILDPSIKCVNGLVVKDPNKLSQMNLQEVKFQKGLAEWMKCITSWAMFGLSYSNAFISITEQVINSSYPIIDKARSLTIKLNKEKQN